MLGGEFPGMNYFHPGMPVPPPTADPTVMTTSSFSSSFPVGGDIAAAVAASSSKSSSVPPNVAKSNAIAAASAPTVIASTSSPASVNNLPLPTPLFHNDANKRKAANDAILQYQLTAAKKQQQQRQQSSSTTTTTTTANNSAVVIDLSGTTTTTTTQQQQVGKSSTSGGGGRIKFPDPPGFEAFQRDKSFITSIMANRMKENGNTDPLLGPLARGIINMSDEDIYKLSNDDNDATMKAFVADVIMPLLGIDDTIARSSFSAWQGYAHISSENLRSVAKNFFYVRRSSMKAAVQVAFYEMKKNHLKIVQAEKGKGSKRKSSSSEEAVSASASSAKRIQQLERALIRQKEDNAKMTKQIEEIYENDIADMRNDHRLHIEELKQAHKKEVDALKEEMEDMKCSHREFLGHYVEAAAEAVRLAQIERKSSSSFGRAVSDLL